MEDSGIAWYKNNYNKVNATAIEDSISFKVLHGLIEFGVKSTHGIKILEIGGNKGEHVYFVKPGWNSYLLTDINSIDASTENILKSVNVMFEIADAEKLEYADGTFDRVIVTCVMHHLANPEKAFREIRRVLKPGGKADILLPNDPGLVYRLLRNLTTVRKAKKVGLRAEVEIVHAREHRNHYLALEVLLKNVFKNDSVTSLSFPFVFKNYHLNAITRFRITKIQI